MMQTPTIVYANIYRAILRKRKNVCLRESFFFPANCPLEFCLVIKLKSVYSKSETDVHHVVRATFIYNQTPVTSFKSRPESIPATFHTLKMSLVKYQKSV